MKFSRLIKQVLVCLCLFALTGQAIADPLAKVKRELADLKSAYSAYHAGDYAKAGKLFEPIAEQGDVSIQIQLCSMYRMGDDTSHVYKGAVRWCRQLAEQGDSFGQWMLGVMYDQGKVVPQDFKEAVRWLRLAAAQGDSDAQRWLGTMYYQGEGVLQDYKEAARWFRLSAEQGNADGQGWLGGLYQQGGGRATRLRSGVYVDKYCCR